MDESSAEAQLGILCLSYCWIFVIVWDVFYAFFLKYAGEPCIIALRRKSIQNTTTQTHPLFMPSPPLFTSRPCPDKKWETSTSLPNLYLLYYSSSPWHKSVNSDSRCFQSAPSVLFCLV